MVSQAFVYYGVFRGETCTLYLCMAKDAGIYVEIALRLGELQHDEFELLSEASLLSVLLDEVLL